MDAVLIKSPDLLGFSGNPMPFVLSLQPYGDGERATDIRVMVRLYVETNVGSETFEEAKSQNFYPDNDGFITMDVHTIVDAYLQFFQPKKNQNTPIVANGQTCRYMIVWQVNNQGTLEDAYSSDKYVAVKGVISYENWPSQYRSLPTSDVIPLFRSDLDKKVLDSDLNWLYWYQVAGTAYKARFTLLWSDGTTSTQDSDAITVPVIGNTVCMPVGIGQMKLYGSAMDKSIIRYTVQILKSNNTVASNMVTYVVDAHLYAEKKQLIWRDSLGGLDSISLIADIDYAADYDRESAVRTLPPNYYNQLVARPQNVVSNVSETMNLTAYTPWLSQEEAMQLRSLFTAMEMWEHDNGSGKIRPAILTAKSIKFFTNTDDLIALELAYSHAFTNQGYTAESYGDTTQSCPALDKLEVSQISKNYLRITYSMPIPYNQMDLVITVGTVTYHYVVDGNFGVFSAYIDQVSADTTASIVGKVICDEFASPVSEGPATSKNMTIVRWIPPIANDDYFSTTKNTPISSYGRIVIGGLISYHLTTTAVNIFDNDYSTDGDGFKIPSTWESSGPTNAGGTYSLWNGYLNYTPPTDFTGQDWFDYQIVSGNILNTSAPATARVYINIDTLASTSKVYAKKVYVYDPNPNWINDQKRTGKAVVRFYSDPEGTKSLDVTGRGISLIIRKYQYDINNSGNGTQTDSTVSAAGTETTVYTGYFQNGSQYTSIKLQPGTGYITLSQF